MTRHERLETVAAIRKLAADGYGIEDIRVRLGLSWRTHAAMIRDIVFEVQK